MAETALPTRQIKDGAITNAKIAAGAGINTSKLEDGADFVKRTGTVAMTGNLAMGNNKITGLTTATNSDEAVNLGQLNSALANLPSIFSSKDSVRAASTANVTVSNPGTSIFDGVTLANGERVLLKNQTAPAENGIYIFNGSASALTRATDFDAWTEIPGGWVVVEEGTVNADTVWLSTANQGGTLGTTAVTFMAVPMTQPSGFHTDANFIDHETPSGSVNGSNTAFTLANTPIAGSVHLYVNGLLMESGAGNDYTISGANITMLYALASGEKIKASYRIA